MAFIDNQDEMEYDPAIVRQIARSAVHLRKVKAMVEDGKDCSEVLIKLSAVKNEIEKVRTEILKHYMSATVDEAVMMEDMEKIKEISKAIDWFMK